MPWPTATEFSDAIQNPLVCFREDPELAGGRVALYPSGGRKGMPIVATGQFACVYKASVGNREVAVRCFTREVKDQQLRYSSLHDYLDTVLPDSFVRFRYLEQGILVKGQWYPIVRMDWANGEPLNKFVQQNLGNSEVIAGVAARWRGAVGSLRGLGIAHNDLQHGNVMVEADRLHLVDYDGIFLPSFQGERSPETGHRNYQHPQRSADNYDAQIDNFPALAIYLSLLALRADPDLWEQFYNDDNLLLTHRDYANPGDSECLGILKQSRDDQVRKLAAKLGECCSLPVQQVPDLESIIQGRVASAPTPAPAPPPTPPTTAAPGAYRDLLQTPPATAQPQPAAPTNTLVKCPQCGRNNDAGLIYCVNNSCQATLLTATRICACRSHIPANARFCPQCGRRRNQPAATHNSVPQPANPATRMAAASPSGRPPASPPPAAGKTCSSCGSSVSASANHCTWCGKAV